jgi:uncharacterized protein (TIRG00374 family)
VRTALLLATNLVVGGGLLVWVLRRFGEPALAALAAHFSLPLLVAFVLTAGCAIVVYAARWQLLLRGLGTRIGLGRLSFFRAAGQSLSALIPSGKLGGEPMRAYLLLTDGVPGAKAIASVAVDRTLEMTAGAAFACLYGAVLLRRGVPALEGAMVTVALSAAALAFGIAITVRRLKRGAGLVTAMARTTGLDRLPIVQSQMGVLEDAENATTQLLAQRNLLARAFAAGVVANLGVLVEYAFLLAAFGLPAGPLAIVAALFASGAAHALPVPVAIGVLEGAQIFIFGILGHGPEVGLAVGLAVRLRELVWLLPGLVYLLARGIVASWARPVAGRAV